MLLDNVVHDRAEISEPWRAFARLGNSLFLWSLVYGIVCFIVFVLLAGIGILTALIPCIKAESFVPQAVPGLVLVGTLALVFVLVAAYISRFLEDFVVPIMYKNDLTAVQAWGRFLGLLRPSFWSFVLYGVFYLLLALLSGIICGIVGLVTCFVGCCLMAIPYIGAVVLLPVAVFFRAYSLEYLRQFGEEYEIFPVEADGSQVSG
jgi:hypothetical protein